MARLLRVVISLVALGAGAVIAAIPGGCSRPSPPIPATVRGQVTFQGQPLAGGLIVFSPDPDRGCSGRPARGELDSNGAFQLKLGDDPAIPPGWYRVAIAPPALMPMISYPNQPRFPPQLARPDQSGLIREVRAATENVFSFAVEIADR
jgi:hypothetical protein